MQPEEPVPAFNRSSDWQLGRREDVLELSEVVHNLGAENTIVESFDASVSTDMLTFETIRELWDIVLRVIPEGWLAIMPRQHDFEDV